MESQTTYSKSNVYEKRATLDLFDQVVLRDIAFDGVNGKKYAREKMVRPRGKGKKENQQNEKLPTEAVDEVCFDSPTMFQLDEIPKRKKRKRRLLTPPAKRGKFPINKRAMASSPERAARNREEPCFETAETSPSSLFIESPGTLKEVSKAENMGDKKFPSEPKWKPVNLQKDQKLVNSNKKGSKLRGFHSGKKGTQDWPNEEKEDEISHSNNEDQNLKGRPNKGKSGRQEWTIVEKEDEIMDISRKGYKLRKCNKGKKINYTEDRACDWEITEKSLLARMKQSSIEIARDREDSGSIISLSMLRKGSKLIPLQLSPISGDQSDDLFNDTDKLGWVSVSSGPKDGHGTSGSSQYTYISTYTYGSTTVTLSKSPTVSMQNKQPPLTSTVQRGKCDLKEKQFPDFLSPIGPKAQSSKSKRTVSKLSVSGVKEKRVQKCSTVFLESDSCLGPMESPDLTAITSGTVQSHGQEGQNPSGPGAPQLTEKGSKKCQRHASTPKDKAAFPSLNISPVRSSSVNEEFELPMRDSTREIDTSEIIVPSLMDITDLPPRERSSLQISKDPEDNLVFKSKRDVCSDSTGQYQQLQKDESIPNLRESGPEGKGSTEADIICGQGGQGLSKSSLRGINRSKASSHSSTKETGFVSKTECSQSSESVAAEYCIDIISGTSKVDNCNSPAEISVKCSRYRNTQEESEGIGKKCRTKGERSCEGTCVEIHSKNETQNQDLEKGKAVRGSKDSSHNEDGMNIMKSEINTVETIGFNKPRLYTKSGLPLCLVNRLCMQQRRISKDFAV